MKILLFLISPFLLFVSQNSIQSFPFQELTTNEFIEYESSLGSNIQELDTTEVFLMGVSEDVYPYANSYKLDQLYQGERPIGKDSIVTKFEAFHVKESKLVKYLSYTFRPKVKSFEEVANELHEEQKYSGDRLRKRLKEQVTNQDYQEKIRTKYEELAESFSQKGKLIENRERTEGVELVKIKTYKINEAFVELAITPDGEYYHSIGLAIFWK